MFRTKTISYQATVNLRAWIYKVVKTLTVIADKKNLKSFPAAWVAKLGIWFAPNFSSAS